MTFPEVYALSLCLYFIAQGGYFFIHRKTYKFKYQASLILFPATIFGIVRAVERMFC